jgi:hypothetical protein
MARHHILETTQHNILEMVQYHKLEIVPNYIHTKHLPLHQKI